MFVCLERLYVYTFHFRETMGALWLLEIFFFCAGLFRAAHALQYCLARQVGVSPMISEFWRLWKTIAPHVKLCSLRKCCNAICVGVCYMPSAFAS